MKKTKCVFVMFRRETTPSGTYWINLQSSSLKGLSKDKVNLLEVTERPTDSRSGLCRFLGQTQIEDSYRMDLGVKTRLYLSWVRIDTSMLQWFSSQAKMDTKVLKLSFSFLSTRLLTLYAQVFCFFYKKFWLTSLISFYSSLCYRQHL